MKTLDTIKTDRLTNKITSIESEIGRCIGIGNKVYNIGCTTKVEYDYIISALTAAGYKYKIVSTDDTYIYTIIVDIA